MNIQETKNTEVNNDVLLGFWRCVHSSVDADVSEKHTVSMETATVMQNIRCDS
jgi:hypothetical protein